jgi:hypothetical protein
MILIVFPILNLKKEPELHDSTGFVDEVININVTQEQLQSFFSFSVFNPRLPFLNVK